MWGEVKVCLSVGEVKVCLSVGEGVLDMEYQ